MKSSKWILLVATVFCFVTANAFAVPIDFTHPDFSSAFGESYFSITREGVELTFDPNPGRATLYWDAQDGLGVIYSYEYDEIEFPEWLTIGFTTPVFLSSIFITDLFRDEVRGSGQYDEIGLYFLVADSTPILSFFDANDLVPYDASNGEGSLLIGQPNVSSITFSAPGKLIPGQDHDFSVKGVDVTPVPEPATILLLGSGLVGLGLLGRKKLMRS